MLGKKNSVSQIKNTVEHQQEIRSNKERMSDLKMKLRTYHIQIAINKQA
jgi:hypothetical protein